MGVMESNSALIKHFGFGLAGEEEGEAAGSAVDFDDRVRFTGSGFGEDRFHRFDGGDDLAIGGEVVVISCGHFREAS